MSRLDDTSRCPLGDWCETCGSAYDLGAVTAGTRVGVYCLTLCVTCIDEERLPAGPSWVGTAVRVAAHCQHLRIDLDEMGRLMEDDDD